jgi:hypothetical protein
MCIKLVLIKELYYDARPTKSQDVLTLSSHKGHPQISILHTGVSMQRNARSTDSVFPDLSKGTSWGFAGVRNYNINKQERQRTYVT